MFRPLQPTSEETHLLESLGLERLQVGVDGLFGQIDASGLLPQPPLKHLHLLRSKIASFAEHPVEENNGG